ncbi:MAG: hypothetical protein AB1665_04625 [Candidatus Thermoplasmatota archaeon]
MSDVPLGAASAVPRLITSVLFTALRCKRRMKKSARGFMRGLERGGMNRKDARRLLERYEEGLSIRRLLRRAL